MQANNHKLFDANYCSDLIQYLITGQGIFETMLFEDNILWFWEKHEQRLKSALKYFNTNFNSINLKNLILSKIEEFGKKNLLRIKLVVLLPFDKEHKRITEKNIVIQIKKINRQTGYLACKLKTEPWAFTTDYSLLGLKTINYGHNFNMLWNAKEQGFDDVLFVDNNNQVIETSVANIFAVRENNIFTPPLGDWILPGVIRGLIMDYFNAQEKVILLNDINQFDYFFLTNSIHEIQKIDAIDSNEFTRGLDHFQDLTNRWQEVKKQYKDSFHTNLNIKL